MAVQPVEYAFHNQGIGGYQSGIARVVAPGLSELVDVIRGDLCQRTELIAGAITQVTAPLVFSIVLVAT